MTDKKKLQPTCKNPEFQAMINEIRHTEKRIRWAESIREREALQDLMDAKINALARWIDEQIED